MDDKALIFDLKRDASEDGPGIRTTVFFKGCPLSCVWCQNPEGKLPKPECDIHGKQIGARMTLDELLYRLLQDKTFYTNSGGGVTLSGGEPTLQMYVAGQLLQRLKAEGVNTAVETCGFFNYRRFSETMLPWLDLIYFDLKLIDDPQSRKYCGRSNAPILKNFTRLLKSTNIPVVPRIPLIPGITTTKENLRGFASFLMQHGVQSCSLMPYNPLWKDKLQDLGIEPAYNHTNFMTLTELRDSANCFIA